MISSIVESIKFGFLSSFFNSNGFLIKVSMPFEIRFVVVSCPANKISIQVAISSSSENLSFSTDAFIRSIKNPSDGFFRLSLIIPLKKETIFRHPRDAFSYLCLSFRAPPMNLDISSDHDLNSSSISIGTPNRCIMVRAGIGEA